MPAASGKGLLMEKLGQKFVQAHNEVKNNEVVYGRMELPAGVEGVARLTKMSVQVGKPDSKIPGQLYWTAQATVISPKRYEGYTTDKYEPIAETPNTKRKTIADHMSFIYNEMGKLGVPVSQLNPEQVESAMAQLVKLGPTFAFRTWKGDVQTTGEYAGKEPRVQHDWQKRVEYDPATDQSNDDGVEDGTGAAEETVNHPPQKGKPGGAGSTRSASPATTGTARTAPASKATETTSPSEDDIPALVKAADAKKDSKARQAAQDRLAELASAAGVPDDDVNNAENWAAVAEMIANGGGGDGEAGGETEAAGDKPDPEAWAEICDSGQDDGTHEELLTNLAAEFGIDPDDYPDSWGSLAAALREQLDAEAGGAEEAPAVPEKGQHWSYNGETHEVVAAFPDKATATVKNLATGKLVRNVKFSDLSTT